MKTLLTRSTLLLGLMTCASAAIALPALSQTSAHPLFDMRCEQGYYVGVLQNANTGEFSYRSKGPSGELGLPGGAFEDYPSKEVYAFRNDAYVYQVTRAKGGSKKGHLQVYQNGHSIMSLSCTQP